MGCFVYILDNYLVQISFHSHFNLVSLLLVLEATESVSEPITQVRVELINNHVVQTCFLRRPYSTMVFHSFSKSFQNLRLNCRNEGTSPNKGRCKTSLFESQSSAFSARKLKIKSD